MIDVSKFNSLIELLEAFPDEESCIVYLEKLRWRNGKVKSPFDKKSKVYYGNYIQSYSLTLVKV